MDTLGKLRSNFLNRNNFNVGFSNRSPLSAGATKKPTYVQERTQENFNIPTLGGKGAAIGQAFVDGNEKLSNAAATSANHISSTINETIKGVGEVVVKNQETKKAQEAAEAKRIRMNDFPAFVENWQKENPAYDMDDFKAKYGEELNEWMKNNAPTTT